MLTCFLLFAFLSVIYCHRSYRRQPW